MMKGELLRDTHRGQIAGVCAGIAEYFGWELWLVRIIAVSGFLLTGSVFFVGYIIAWIVLDKKKHISEHSVLAGDSAAKASPRETLDMAKIEVKSKVWQAGAPPNIVLSDIERRFLRLERRLRCVESYVTSSEFQLNRELRKL